LLSLQSAPSMPTPPVQKLFVDERYEEVEYGGARASISLLSGGGIAIRGGCGEEILLQGGNITLSAPGDLRCLFGRSAVTLAGDDIVLRAKNSVDVTATDKDVRVKADRNLDMVGGMSGTGRTLLENKATRLPSLEGVQEREGEDINGAGVVIRASDSVLASYAQRIYTRSLNSGEIFIDADNGNGSVKTRAGYVGVNAKKNVVFGVNDGSNIVQLTPTNTLMTAPLNVDERIRSSQTVRADRGCNAEPLPDPTYFTHEETIAYINGSKENYEESNIVSPNELYYDEQGLGTGTFIAAYTFSYRNSEQCGAHRFSFDELYWMELYGQTAIDSLATWDERVYVYQSTIDQVAWPGYEKWVEDECVTVGKTRLYDASSGNDIDRLEGGTPQEQTNVTPANFYRVIGNG